MIFKFSSGVRAALAINYKVTREVPGSGKLVHKDEEITDAETEAHKGQALPKVSS